MLALILPYLKRAFSIFPLFENQTMVLFLYSCLFEVILSHFL